MSYRIRQEEDAQTALRRIAQEEVDRAVAEAVDGRLDDRRAIHQARKRVKRLRGLLALYDGTMDRRTEENDGLRQLGHELGGLRDADSLVAAARGLRERVGEKGRPALDPVVAAVELRRARAARDDVDPSWVRRLVAGRMEELRVRSDSWRVEATGWRAFEQGFAHEYAGARAALDHFAHDAPLPLVHELRKAVKRHWYHTRLIQDCDPKRLKRRRSSLGMLGEILGEDHDLGILGRVGPELELDTATGDALQAAIRRHQIRLRERAGKLADRLFAQGTTRFVASVGLRWGRWIR